MIINNAPDITSAIRSWCLTGLAIWRMRRLSYTSVYEECRMLNATHPDIFVFNIRYGEVSLTEKPDTLNTGATVLNRARLYLQFIQDTVTTNNLDVHTSFAMALSDECPESTKAPIFAFQKPAGSLAVLLPDIDFLVNEFYENETANDKFEYDQKSTSAMFVGATTGAHHTEQIVRDLTSPRLRAAVYFKSSAKVEFLLPLIVQCDTQQTEELIRDLGFGNGVRIDGRAQMLHKFIISMDGNGATCSRVVIALKSNSVLLKYNSPHLLYYFHHLIPWRHYIPIASDHEVEDIVQMELDNPGLFRFIASEGRAFAERYLTKSAVSRYTAELIRFYAATFASEAAIAPPPTIRAGGPSNEDLDEEKTEPVAFEYMGHIQDRGDDWAMGGTWLGEAGSKRSIEGIMLRRIADITGVSWQAVLHDGRLTNPAHDGEFCGTRGRRTPICGFRINLEGDAAQRLKCHCFATFVDGSKVGPVLAGHTCQSRSLAPLESLRIELHSQRPVKSNLARRPSNTLRRVNIDGFARVSPLHGMPYLEFLKLLHSNQHVYRYLEIGTNSGMSLTCATGQAVAIDPAFQLDKAAWAAKPGINLFEMTSDDFFASHDPISILGGTIDFAFIDGMHRSEFVLRDFMNVERHSARQSFVVLHDAVPENFEMTERDFSPSARRDKELAGGWTGDVWRIVPLLRRERPDLRIQVLDCPPTGLVLVSNLDPQCRTLLRCLDRLTGSLVGCEPTEAEFWSFIESLTVTDSRTALLGGPLDG